MALHCTGLDRVDDDWTFLGTFPRPENENQGTMFSGIQTQEFSEIQKTIFFIGLENVDFKQQLNK